MAPSSQGDDDNEEQKALEQELAAELAALTAQDVGLDNSSPGQWTDTLDDGDAVDYIRLDLDEVLKQTAMDEVPDKVPQAASSWELFLQNVERNDREFYQLLHQDLREIRTVFLDEPLTHTPNQDTNQDIDKTEELGSKQGTDQSQADEEASRLIQDPTVLSREVLTATEIPDAPSEDAVVAVQQDTEDTAVVFINPTPSEPINVHGSWPKNHAEVATVVQELPVDDGVTQKEFNAIEQQQAARELRRLKIQERQRQERDEAARLLKQIQQDFEAQERVAEMSRREEHERSAMAGEEISRQKYIAAKREAKETIRMSLADEASRQVEAEAARMQAGIDKEIRLMSAEDQAERQRLQIERYMRHQQQSKVARGRFDAVLAQIVQHHRLQKQIMDQQVKRERRECAQMRAEDAYARRLVAETRANWELQERDRNRSSMALEDELAHAQRRQLLEWMSEERCRVLMKMEETHSRSAWDFISNLQRLQREKEKCSCVSMEQEEIRCRNAWKYHEELQQAEALERERERETQRIRRLVDVSSGLRVLGSVYRRHEIRQCLEKWRRWNCQCAEEAQALVAAVESAARKIQIWHRSRQRRQQTSLDDLPLVLEDFSDVEDQPTIEEDESYNFESTESQEAARRLQSTFRGFHVRRKFTNALALAQAVEGDNEDDYEAVDLEDLIQLPPELVDGWENPVLPTTTFVPRDCPSPRQSDNYEEDRLEFDDEDATDDGSNPQTNTLETVKGTDTIVPAKEQNFAASLWNKMKRTKQRQRHAQQERQRQQDPVYRVQKVLNRGSRSSSGSNQTSHSRSQTLQGPQKAPMVSWSSTSNAKKKLKVKLPSLVERLRRQTMAER